MWRPGWGNTNLTVPYHPNRALCSQTAHLLVVPAVFKSGMGDSGLTNTSSLMLANLCITEPH